MSGELPPSNRRNKSLSATGPNRQLKVESNLLTAIVAGVTASVAQTTLTYPFEFSKTIIQLHRDLPTSPPVDLGHQFKFFFSGCGALNIGNALKSGSRFIVFNSASKFMATDSGKTSASRLVVAGAMTGSIESLWIIPFENLKTTMIESALILSRRERGLDKGDHGGVGNKNRINKFSELDRPDKLDRLDGEAQGKKTFHNQSNIPKEFQNHPFILAKKKWDRFPATNFLQSIQEIYQTRGLRGYFQGTAPTLFRQCSNSAVQFGTYASLRQLFAPHNGEVNSYLSLGISVVSSIMVVALTQPIDVVKTRMQSRETYYIYKNSVNCAYRIFVEEGIRTFWSGWIPRLLKVSTSSGIVFTVYNHIENQMKRALSENPFKPE